MVLSLVAFAAAATCPGDHSSVQAGLASLESSGGGVLEVAEGCAPGDLTALRGGAFEVTCVDGTACVWPALSLTGSTMTVSGGSFGPSVHQRMPLDALANMVGANPLVTVYASESVVTLSGTRLGPGTGDDIAVLALDSDVRLDGVEASGFGDVVKSFAYAAWPSLEVEGSTLTGNSFGVLVSSLAYVTQPREVTIHGSTFADNLGDWASDLYVSADSVTIEDSFFTGGSAGQGSPQAFHGADLVIRRTEFTGSRGAAAQTFVATECPLVELDRVRITDVVGTTVLAVEGYGAISIHDSDLELSGLYQLAGGSMLVERNAILVRPDGTAPGIRADRGTLEVHHNEFCSAGGRADLQFGLISAQEGDLYVSENVFHGLLLRGAALVDNLADDGTSTSLTTSVVFIENTLVDVQAAALYTGEASTLLVIDDLFSDSPLGLAPVGSSVSLAWDYNLHHSTSGTYVAPPDGQGNHDRLVDTPGFVATYATGRCGSVPALAAGSEAIEGGDPGLSVDGIHPPDIGAIDRGAEGEWPVGWVDTGGLDTGDTGDTGEGDNDGDGWTDADDCAPFDPTVFPGALDVPDDGVDQDCDGVPAHTDYAGGCGCASGGASGALAGAALAVGLLAARARRR